MRLNAIWGLINRIIPDSSTPHVGATRPGLFRESEAPFETLTTEGKLRRLLEGGTSIDVDSREQGFQIMKLWMERQKIPSSTSDWPLTLHAFELKITSPLYALVVTRDGKSVSAEDESLPLARTASRDSGLANPLPSIGELQDLMLDEKRRRTGFQIITPSGVTKIVVERDDIVITFEGTNCLINSDHLRLLANQARQSGFNGEIVFCENAGNRIPVFTRSTYR